MPRPASAPDHLEHRAPNLHQSIWQQLLRKVRPGLRATFAALLDDLLSRADRAPSAKQNRLLEIRQQVAEQQDALLDHYCRSLRERPLDEAPRPASELTLVSHEEQEEEVLLHILSNRATDRAGSSLRELLGRLEKLSPPNSAIAPADLLQALCKTLKPCVDDLDIRTLAYGHFEEHFLRLLPDAYRQWNQQLAERGVTLSPTATDRPKPPPRHTAPKSATAQPGPPIPASHDATPALDLIDQLQHALARQLKDNRLKPQPLQQMLQSQLGHSTGCDTETRQVADWVDMIMEYIRQDQQLSEPTRQALGCLQPTMIRIALQDRSLFTQSRHPARLLLERLTRASLMYQGESLEPRVQDKIQQLVLDLLDQFDGDLSLLARLNDDIDSFLTGLQQQAERVEKRQIEQVQGQERLLSARQYAQECIANRVRKHRVAPILREFLEHSWVNVLLLLELQHGRDSQAWRDGMALADTLLEQAYSPLSELDPARSLRQRFDLFQALRAHLSMLVELGSSQIDQYLNTLSQAIQAIRQKNTDLLKSLQFGARPQAIGQLSEDGPRNPPTRTNVPPPELQPYLERIESLPFGTWLHFDEQLPARQKMAWYSPVSHNCLFVDRQGHRTQLLSTRELACLMRDAKARPVEESDLESTWLSKMLGFLKEKIDHFGDAFSSPIEIAAAKR